MEMSEAITLAIIALEAEKVRAQRQDLPISFGKYQEAIEKLKSIKYTN